MSDQFKRLGVIGDFEHPYLTLRPEFEARQVEIFGEMAKKGYIYKGMKAVYWCPDCRTALAEAEIEYGEDDCDSIFVRFHVSQDPNGVLAKHGIPMDKTYFVIWTTTTWTLPANVAVCLNGAFRVFLCQDRRRVPYHGHRAGQERDGCLPYRSPSMRSWASPFPALSSS